MDEMSLRTPSPGHTNSGSTSCEGSRCVSRTRRRIDSDTRRRRLRCTGKAITFNYRMAPAPVRPQDRVMCRSVWPRACIYTRRDEHNGAESITCGDGREEFTVTRGEDSTSSLVAVAILRWPTIQSRQARSFASNGYLCRRRSRRVHYQGANYQPQTSGRKGP